MFISIGGSASGVMCPDPLDVEVVVVVVEEEVEVEFLMSLRTLGDRHHILSGCPLLTTLTWFNTRLVSCNLMCETG